MLIIIQRGFTTAFLTPGRTPGTFFATAAAVAIARFTGRQRGMGNPARHGCHVPKMTTYLH